MRARVLIPVAALAIGSDRLYGPAPRGSRRGDRRRFAAPCRGAAGQGPRLPLPEPDLDAGAGPGRRARHGGPRHGLQPGARRDPRPHLHGPQHVRRRRTQTPRSSRTTRSRSWAATAASRRRRERTRRTSWRGSGEELRLHDPVGDPTDAYLYLYRQTGNLDPGAGRRYVTYNFNLLSGDYKTTYKLNTGPNPEDSTVTTAFYTQHFSDRWADDALKITGRGASGVDILDRHKDLFAPGNCGRSEDTFDAGEGAFIANKSGPVRAIRSYVGANSGPLTRTREHLLRTPRGHPTFLRVHAIPGVLDFFDYSPAASGMTYKNNADRAAA